MLVHEIFDIFKGKEKTIGDDPQYKGWLNIYLKNPDAAEMHKDHKKFLAYFKQTNTNENFLDKVKGAFSSIMPADMDDLIAWVNKNLRRKGTQWIYNNVNKEFGSKHFTKYDVDKAIGIVMKRG